MTNEEIERFALPVREAERVGRQILDESVAYRRGWEEGLFAPLVRTAPLSDAITLFEGMDRLAFWRSHRDGRGTREELLASGTPAKQGYATTPWPSLAVDYGV
jgi:hypothetical protein